MACVVAGWTTAPAPCRADESGVDLPIYNVPIAPRSGGALEHSVAPSVDASEAGTPQRPSFRLSRDPARFAVIELPPDAAVPGTSYKRPHHAFGYRWQAAESWLRDRGLDAQTCYLPMVRLHSKFGADGASGTLWVYGRCTFK